MYWSFWDLGRQAPKLQQTHHAFCMYCNCYLQEYLRYPFQAVFYLCILCFNIYNASDTFLRGMSLYGC